VSTVRRQSSPEPAGIKPKAFTTRLLTGLAYSLIILVALWAGVIPTAVVFGIMAAFGAWEFYVLERRERRQPNEVFGVIAAAAMPIAAALWGLRGLSATVTALFAASLFWHVMFPRIRTADTAETIFGALYTGFLLGYLVLVRELNDGLLFSVALVASVWAADSVAFVVGSLIGRHKMFPVISPKKSWEGFLAGVVACVLVWCIAVWLPVPHPAAFDLTLAVLTGLGVAVASLVGDLAESRFKREAGVKDSGDALPGHGGFLDRLDSLIFACLVAFWILYWGGVR
jgi:phosphatidate cytidylyltransferase